MTDIRSLPEEVRRATGGMLPIAVYERLHEAVRSLGGGVIAEVGTARGAATVAMALGGKASGDAFHFYTADPFDRGSRLAVGSVEDNRARVLDAFSRFGVDADVTLVVGDSADLAQAIGDQEIDLLLIDADGCIDRDLGLLFDRLSPQCLIVIDDVDDRIYAHRRSKGWLIDQKHRLSHLLVDRFCNMQMLIPIEVVGQTGFYSKGPARVGSSEIAEAAMSAYRELVLAPVRRGQVGWRASFLARLREAIRRR